MKIYNILLRLPYSISCLFLCLTLCTTAQVQDARLLSELAPRISTFSLEEGLSQVTINDLVMGEDGFVWVATQEGLNRFDGQQFKIYRHEDTLRHSLNSNYINKLLIDHSGLLWVGTLGGGLHYYITEVDQFHTVELNEHNDHQINIEALAVDTYGTRWVGTNLKGLHRLRGDETAGFDHKVFNPESTFTAIHCSADRVWVGDDQGAVFVFDPRQDNINLSQAILQVNGQVRTIQYARGKLFIGTDTGLYEYDEKEQTQALLSLNDEGASPPKYISDLLLMNEEHIWIASGSGLFLYDLTQGQVVKKIIYQEHKSNGLSNNTVQSLLALSNEKLFVGTAKNLNLVDYSEPYFKNISKNQRGAHLLNDNIIFSIFRDGADLWVGTSDGGLNLIRETKVYYFKENKDDPGSITGNVVRGIKKDAQRQRLWLATTRGLSMIDLATFDPENPRFEVFHHDPDDLNSINHDFIKDICLDRKGNVWGATAGHGVFQLTFVEPGTVTVRRFKHDPNNQNSLVHDVAQGILEDQQGNIWIGTRNGLSCLKLSNGKAQFKNYKHQEDDNTSLSHDNVYDLMLDQQGRLWLGTRKGLNLKLNTDHFKSWTAQDQFSNDVVYSVQNDKEDNLWMGTNEGIVFFDPVRNTFRQYRLEDGIQSNEFDLHAKYLDEDGNIYLGGINGLTFFNPTELLEIDQPKILYFSEFRIRDQLVQATSEKGSFLSKSIEQVQKIKLGASDFPFYLSFSVKDFRQYRNVQYVYRLQPGEEQWNSLEDNEIQFLNLASGDYTLQINGKSRGEIWDQAPLEMELEISPPWWRSNIAFLIYTLLLFLIVYGIYQFLLNRKIEQQETLRLKELDAFKTRFYDNITHEFRTPLTVIQGMAQEISEYDDQSIQEKSFLIQKNSNNLLELINQMLDLSKLQAGRLQVNLRQRDVINYVRYLVESYESYARSQGLGLHFYSEIDALVMDVDEQKLERIIINLISNAIKFTPEHGKILLVCKSLKTAKGKQLQLMVQDNGVGIPEDQLPLIFERYHQSSDNYQEYGSGIGLALVKELVEFLEGTIEVESQATKGTKFFLKLPIRRTAPLYDPKTEAKELSVPIYRGENEVTPFANDELIDEDQPILLLIEDNSDVALYIQNCVSDTYRVFHSINGRLGVEAALEMIPDIVICDVMMPEMDGFTVCQKLKTDERTNHIPIILLTAKATAEDKLAGLGYGADAYLTKPFDKEELLTRLSNLLEMRKVLQKKYSAPNYGDQRTNTDIPMDIGIVSKASANNQQHPFLAKVEKIILDRLEDEDLSVNELSRQLHLSTSQTYRKIKALTGMSTALFVRQIRLREAKRLLLSEYLSISEVAYQTGFRSPVYFSQVFKEVYGESPSIFVKKQS